VKLQHGSAYLSTDRGGRFLLSADYGGGAVDVYALNEAGAPGARVAGLNEGRKHAHGVLPSPDNRFVYIPYVKDTNALFQYRFDAATGRLTPLEPKDASPPAGTGPRHLAYHPKLPIVYFSNEQHVGVSVYDRAESGQLTIRQVCDAMPTGESKEGISSSDIVITPDGRFLFAGIRGHSRAYDWVARYRIEKNGEVALLGLTPADKIPWGFALSPDGAFLVVSAFDGATLTAYRIGEAGELDKLATLACDKNISDVVTR
jgi:6-phosphogluconolactonase